jgi:hypothetical protein
MKKSTLVLVLIALVLGGFVYYYEFKRAPATEKSGDTSKPAFSFPASDIAGLTLERAGQKISFEKHGEDWLITRPVETRADRSVLEGIATGLASARVSRTFPAAADRLVTYGLTNPPVTLEIKLKNGQQHRLQLGAKDFSGLSVYGIVDGAKDVALLPDALLSSTDKPLDDLRDRSVLDLSAWDVTSFDLKNKGGEVSAAKPPSGWKIEKPRSTAADAGEIESLLAQVASGKMTRIESETATNLAKYGLEKPEVVLRVHDLKGEERGLLVGRKADDDYYARDSARPLVFRINADLYKKLGDTLFALRDKNLIHLQRDQLVKAEIRNKNQTVVCQYGADNKWTLELPADKKGKEVQSWKFLDPLDNARAEEIFDAPSPEILAKLSRPAVEVTLTDKSGNATKVSISEESDGFVYARSSAGPEVYKLNKQILDDLSFKVTDILF